jgi:hypothetical protein
MALGKNVEHGTRKIMKWSTERKASIEVANHASVLYSLAVTILRFRRCLNPAVTFGFFLENKKSIQTSHLSEQWFGWCGFDI